VIARPIKIDLARSDQKDQIIATCDMHGGNLGTNALREKSFQLIRLLGVCRTDM
jgi:hypothetical protein